MTRGFKEGDSLQGARRTFLALGAGIAGATVAATASAASAASHSSRGLARVTGSEHWVTRIAGGETIRLFIWRKRLAGTKGRAPKGAILFVHGSSMASTPVFDLQIPGRPRMSVMDQFARLGYDTWCLDHEGYGRSTKTRNVNCDIANGADDLEAVSEYIIGATGEPKLLMYGSSSGALRAALFAERRPERVKRVALDAFVWTGEGSPTLANRKKRVDQWRSNNRRPIDRAMIESIFTRDHPGTSDLSIVDAFADAVLKLDSSVPTGTYLDMSANLPICTPEKLKVPMLIMRGEYDGIASIEDLMKYFLKVPHPDKSFVIMPGIAHTSLRSKNWEIAFHALETFFAQPAQVYSGAG
jgi:pimeloyl-ACP methyl ester carboxylesterase